ncbi:hypothetical protein PM02_12965 [Sulfitobacter mediterraneus]|uniref:Uncharacterized protein n=1 Tax=Sulfitobacter mediterraneus TaxID=83219 RepID=A0A061SM11_9RHOB|nr:hypothetical protein PM02_12965 [Sulfitobacter mediterraneus]
MGLLLIALPDGWGAENLNFPERFLGRKRRRFENARKAYKPDSVQGLRPWMTIPLTAPLPMQL